MVAHPTVGRGEGGGDLDAFKAGQIVFKTFITSGLDKICQANKLLTKAVFPPPLKLVFPKKVKNVFI